MSPETNNNSESGIVGSSGAMKCVVSEIEKAAAGAGTVLIVGETGTGKELIAKAIHNNSGRHGQPFVAVVCSALTESILESELFGHERGAFTGAIGQRIGKFEQANGGTVFLDEIHTLSIATQAKLLRVLQERVVERVGSSSSQSINLNIRIVAATNQNLKEAVRSGRFREDLLYRLAVNIIEAPPLRKHPEDIPELAALFVKQLAARDNKQIDGISIGALTLLARQAWPGNVRQMQNVIDRAVGDLTVSGAKIDEHIIAKSLGKESVFEKLGLGIGQNASESADAIANLVFEDLMNGRIPLEGIKNRSQSIGAVAECLIDGFETGFKQFLDTQPGQKLLENLSASDVLSRVGLSSRRGGSNALFVGQLRDRLSVVIQQSRNAI